MPVADGELLSLNAGEPRYSMPATSSAARGAGVGCGVGEAGESSEESERHPAVAAANRRATRRRERTPEPTWGPYFAIVESEKGSASRHRLAALASPTRP